MRETKANKEETWKEERKTMQETKKGKKKNPNLQDKNARREKDKSKECSW